MTICPSAFTSDSQQKLIADARAGSPEALGVLLQACRAHLLHIADDELSPELRVKVSPSDLVQETFIVARHAVAGFTGTRVEDFRVWLRGILIHKLAHARRRYLRTARRDLRREAPPAESNSIQEIVDFVWDGETASRLIMHEEQRAAVQQGLSQLPDHYRQVILLRNFELLQFDDIGLIMQRSPGQTRALWGRALKRLAKELHQNE